MDRAVATALIDQLCRELPRGGSDAAHDFDYGWFRARVQSVADHCPPADGIYVWQYAIWHLDAAGLLPDGLSPKFRA